ncbi:MAG: methyltransferase domain-containing protein [Polyangiaceae bacterium]|nr:methyltransferase domain-containing protein [Polyangiaceae bacterium]
MLLPFSPARIAHLGCRVGFPHLEIADRFPESQIVGADLSEPAIALARSKADGFTGAQLSYVVADAPCPGFEAGSFTHALAIHPIGGTEGRATLLHHLHDLLLPGGQAVLSLPVRGSFPEVNDMLREFALRQDLSDLGKAVDVAIANRPTIETLNEELENAGLTDVDVDVSLIAISFASGREIIEDPIWRLMVLADMAAVLPVDGQVLQAAFRYVEDAIQKYWSEGVFELTLNVGCASGRKPA